MNMTAIIMAAGKGARMLSHLPKPLHNVCGAPMIEHVLRALDEVCQEKIVVTGKNGEKVEAACTASEVRPLTDRVVVAAPDVRFYGIDLTYYTTAADASACIQTMEGDGGAIDQYIEWQSAALGRHINPDKLRALMLAPDGETAVGVTRVVINSPQFVELSDTTIAKFNGNMTIRHEVIG